MCVLLKKELATFFGSLIGYVILVVFLLAMGLPLWAFDGTYNVLNIGYANIDGLFILAPWVFLFLIPALSMRFFSEEMKSGTMELLLTMPISDWSIVLGKFFAGLVLLLFALLPTIVYYITVYALGSPVGNVDGGAVVGAYVGLLFIGGLYLAIGTCVSSLTENQIVAFILTAVLCFVFYAGFGFVAESVPVISFIAHIGIGEHYASISRGVIDSRDIVYFIVLIILFLYFTTLSVAAKRK